MISRSWHIFGFLELPGASVIDKMRVRNCEGYFVAYGRK